MRNNGDKKCSMIFSIYLYKNKKFIQQNKYAHNPALYTMLYNVRFFLTFISIVEQIINVFVLNHNIEYKEHILFIIALYKIRQYIMGGIIKNGNDVPNHDHHNYLYSFQPKKSHTFVYNSKSHYFTISNLHIDIYYWMSIICQGLDIKQKQQFIADQQIQSRHSYTLEQLSISLQKQCSLKIAEPYQKQLKKLGSINWKLVTRIYLNNCGVCDSIADVIVNSQLPKLEVLYICKNNLSAQGIIWILRMSNSILKGIHLADNPITSLKPQHLALIKNFDCQFRNLEFLNLDRVRIGAIGTKLIIKLNCPSLTNVLLSYSEMQSEGLKHLVKAHWPVLRRISFQYSYIGLAGFECVKLINSFSLKQVHLGQKNLSVISLLHILAIHINKLKEGQIIGKNECSYNMSKIIMDMQDVIYCKKKYLFRLNQSFSSKGDDQSDDSSQ